MPNAKSFLTTLRHTVFGSTPDKCLTEKERQRNAAMKEGEEEESTSRPAGHINPNRLNIENLTPGTLEFNIAIGMPEPDIETLLACEEFRESFTVAQLRECKRTAPELFLEMVDYANNQLESSSNEILLEVASILSGRKRQIDNARANRKAKADMKKVYPPSVVNNSDGTVSITREELTRLTGAESLDDIPPNPLSVTELIRANRNPDSPKGRETLLNVAKGREDAAKSYETFRDREYQERRNRRIAELGPDNDTAPPVQSVTEKIRANRDRKR